MTARQAAISSLLASVKDADAEEWCAEYIRQHSSQTVAGVTGTLRTMGFTSRDIAAGYARYVAYTSATI